MKNIDVRLKIECAYIVSFGLHFIYHQPPSAKYDVSLYSLHHKPRGPHTWQIILVFWHKIVYIKKKNAIFGWIWSMRLGLRRTYVSEVGKKIRGNRTIKETLLTLFLFGWTDKLRCVITWLKRVLFTQNFDHIAYRSRLIAAKVVLCEGL